MSQPDSQDIADLQAKADEYLAGWKRAQADYQNLKKDAVTMDHIVPISRGGKSTKSNVVVCCKECNNKKKYLLPIEWSEYLDSLAKR